MIERHMKKNMLSRRGLLQFAGGLALAARRLPAAPVIELPKIRLGESPITRLILGSNPFNGYSYGIPSLTQHMREWSTEEHICGVLGACGQNGINTWQFSASGPGWPTHLAALKRHQNEGGKLQWILLSSTAMEDDPAEIPTMAALKPIGMVHHGGTTDRRFRAGEMEKVRDFLKRTRDNGVLAGLSTHDPRVIEYVEERNWDTDFYMACFYQMSRTKEEIRQMARELPLGAVFLDGDPARMCRVIRQTRRPCLAFKILAAGRLAETPQMLEQAFRFAFDNIKPQDAVIVGMYPRFKDEVRQNAGLVQRILGPSSPR